MAKTSGGVRTAITKSLAERARETIRSVISDLNRQGYSRTAPFPIGKTEKAMRDFAAKNGIKLGSEEVYMSSSGIAHALRNIKKTKGLAVSEKELANFPFKRKKMDLYYDTRTGNFTYTDYKSKFIVHPNYQIKTPEGRRKLVNFITASKVTDRIEFSLPEYKKIR